MRRERKKGKLSRHSSVARERSADKGGSQAKPRRILDQDPPARRGQRQTHHLPDHRRTVPRAERFRGSYGAGRAQKTPARTYPRIRPEKVVGEKGYSSNRSRSYLRKRGIGAVIARKVNEPRAGAFDKEAYRQRNLVERLINRLKQFRRVATRYEKRAINYRAMLTIAAIVLWT